jgi:alpha-ribazole phosphatase
LPQIYLVRHGDILAPQNVYYGSKDYDLSDTGLEQARELKRYFTDKNIDTIYTSPLNRAIKTADIIFRDKKNIQTNNDIAERSFGVWEGLTYKELYNNHPDECKEWEKDWIDYQITDGESYRTFHNRVTSFVVKKLISQNEDTICVISHSGVICTIISFLLGMSLEDIWRFKVDKGSVSKIVIDNSGYAYLEMLNFIP